MAEDARAAARRIVEEVLASHDARRSDDGDPAADLGSPTEAEDVAEDPGHAEVSDPRGHPDTMATMTAVADETAGDEPSSRAIARRIVEDVLASHVEAEREVDVPAPVAEAEGPPPHPEAVPVQPVPGRPAVVPAASLAEVTADLPVDTGPAAVADDAASVARRIVESVLAEAAVAEPAAAEAAHTGDAEDAALPDEVAAGAAAAPVLDPDDGPPPHPVESVASQDADGTLRLPAAPIEEPPADDPDGTVALPVAQDEGEPADDPDGTVALPVAQDEEVPEDDPDETLALPVARSDDVPADDPDETLALRTDEGPGSSGGSDEAAAGGVATLAPRTDTSAEATAPVPTAAPPARPSRWLIASILGAVGLAVLLPLAIDALRSLVALG